MGRLLRGKETVCARAAKGHDRRKPLALWGDPVCLPMHLHKLNKEIWEVTEMKRNNNRIGNREERYSVRRNYWGMRTAEEVVAALVKAHR